MCNIQIYRTAIAEKGSEMIVVRWCPDAIVRPIQNGVTEWFRERVNEIAEKEFDRKYYIFFPSGDSNCFMAIITRNLSELPFTGYTT